MIRGKDAPQQVVVPAITLRPYQAACVEHVLDAVTPAGGAHSLFFSLPTSTGKSVILGALAAHFLSRGRVLAVAQLRHIIHQVASHMAAWCGEERVGVVMAVQDEPGAQGVVGSVQTLTRGRLAGLLDADPRPIALLAIDEFHHGKATSYRALIDQVRARSPDCVLVGCSATPFRADTASAELADLFPVCAFERSLDEMQHDGWLRSPIAASSCRWSWRRWCSGRPVASATTPRRRWALRRADQKSWPRWWAARCRISVTGPPSSFAPVWPMPASLPRHIVGQECAQRPLMAGCRNTSRIVFSAPGSMVIFSLSARIACWVKGSTFLRSRRWFWLRRLPAWCATSNVLVAARASRQRRARRIALCSKQRQVGPTIAR